MNHEHPHAGVVFMLWVRLHELAAKPISANVPSKSPGFPLDFYLNGKTTNARGLIWKSIAPANYALSHIA